MLPRVISGSVVFLITYIIFLISGVPAGWAVSRVDAHLSAVDAAVVAAHGSAWHGGGRLQVGGVAVGVLSWSASPWPLVAGHVQAKLRLHGSRVNATARVRVGRHRLRLSGLQGRAALPFVARLAHLPATLHGTLVAQIAELSAREDGVLAAATGALVARDVRLPRLGVSLGTLTLQLATDHGVIHGTLANGGGDLTVAGVLTLRPGGRYALHATLRPHAGRHRLRDALTAVLGAPDANGRFHYAVAGVLRP